MLNNFFIKEEDRVLFFYNDKSYTHKEIARIITKHVQVFERLKEREITLCMQDNLLFIIAFFAALHARKDVVLAQNTKNLAGKIFTDDDFSLQEMSEEANLKPFDVNSSRVFFFTSGSTNEPKKIQKSFYVLEKELEAVDDTIKESLIQNPVVITTVNMFHLYGMTFAFLYAISKNFIIDAKRIDTPEELAEKLEKHQKTFLISSPAFLDRLANYKNNYHFPNKPCLITSSGGPLSKKGAVVTREMLGSKPFEIFGSTETGVVGFRFQEQDEHWGFIRSVSGTNTSDGRFLVKSPHIDGYEYIMEDAVEILDGKSFILKGRLDRLVKIEEKRVSLPEVESTISKSVFIDRIHCIVVENKQGRKGVGACISLSNEGRLFIIRNGRKCLIEELKAIALNSLDKTAIPLKWRFIDEIPLNAQSKILTSEIKNLFEANIPEPVVLSKVIKGFDAELEISFLEKSSYFEGHFPNFNILPAVVQIHFAIYFTNKVFGFDIASIEKMSRIKFSNMIKPNQILKLSLTKAEGVISFKYFDEDNIYSSGSIIVE